MTAPTSRPTPEQVDAALTLTRGYDGPGWRTVGVLAAEVRALRAALIPTLEVRMGEVTAPDWGGEEDDDGRLLYHQAWDSTDGNLRLWVGPYAAGEPEPSWAITIRTVEAADVTMRCTPEELSEWADMIRAAVTDSAVRARPTEVDS